MSDQVEVGDWVVGGRHADDIDVGQITALTQDGGIGGHVNWIGGGGGETWCPVNGQNDYDVFASRAAAEEEASRRREAARR